MNDAASFQPGGRVAHPDFGQGVVISLAGSHARVFFPVGERQMPLSALQPALGHNEAVVAHARGGTERAAKAWLCWKAHEIPISESAAALTSAKIDLLPHQVVLTHRVATASPRRFLIADEVGLGKTIETALILRELASRSELTRVLIVVPAGLVNNWHRELNEVFNLDFEVFGREGDVSDRRSNVFSKHDRLIASIDTLKRPARVKRLLEAPPWDLVGFVMAIFQKIAASSFAAVHRTLRRRLIALTVQEGLVCDAALDIDGRDVAFREARELIRTEWGLGVELSTTWRWTASSPISSVAC